MSDYRIVRGNSINDFEIEVQKYLASGYICQGGVILDQEYGNRYSQAMVKL